MENSLQTNSDKGSTVNAVSPSLSSTSDNIVVSTDDVMPPKLLLAKRLNFRRLFGATLIIVGTIVGSGLALHSYSVSRQASTKTNLSATSTRLKQQTISLSDLGQQINSSAVQTQGTLTVNGQVSVSSSISLLPTSVPTEPSAGQLYFDQTRNQLGYYDGKQFVYLQGGGNTSTTINNSTTIVTNNTTGGGSGIKGTPSVAALFNADGSGLADSSISQSGSLISIAGTERLRAASNSATAFQVQNSGGASLLTADTAGNQIVMGNDGTPVAVTVRGGAASGVDATGANLTIEGSNGTGIANGGDIIFKTGQGASGGIRFDASAQVSPGSLAATSISMNFTTGNQDNRLLVVETDCASSSVTYSGFSLKKLGSATAPSGLGSGNYVELWYMLSPPNGTHTIVATYIANCNNGSGGHFNFGELGAASYYNVNQSTPFGAVATASGTIAGTGTTNLTVTTINTSQIVIDAFGTGDNNYLHTCTTPNAGQTIRWYSHSQYQKIECGSDLAGIAGQVHFNYTVTATDWADVAVPVNPALPGSIPLVSPSSAIPDPMTDRLHITAEGNIGINMADPQATLDIAGTALIQPSIDTHTAFQIQNAGSVLLFAADTINMTISISGTTDQFALLSLNNAHLAATQVTGPTVASPTNCGSGATASVTTGSTDIAGSFTISAGSGAPTTCDTVLTFNKPYDQSPKSIILTSTKAVSSTIPASVWVSNVSPTTFTVQIAPSNAAAGEVYSYYYLIVQ